ncbi:MAG TPA: transcription termination factor NusA, partial [bacterium]|nr:transcription termination factor NusA [bacterium]
GLARAYEKVNNDDFDIKVNIDRETGEINYYQILTIVDKPEDKDFEISLKEVQKYNPQAEIGDTVQVLLKKVNDMSRIGAQISKQIFSQKLKSEERNILYNRFIDKKGEIMTGVIQRKAGNTYFIGIDGSKIDVILGFKDQIPNENYSIGQKISFYIVDIKKDMGSSAKIIASRTHSEFVRKLFEREISEVFDRTIEIKNISRDPGYRCKIGVVSHDTNVDPVGTCVGNRGNRIQSIVRELNNEKIDVIPYDPSAEVYIKNSLKPAQVESVTVNLSEKAAIVVVPKDQYSLAIGRNGQNVRLAAKLTGFKIDVKTENTMSNEQALKEAEALFTNKGGKPAEPEEAPVKAEKPKTKTKKSADKKTKE